MHSSKSFRRALKSRSGMRPARLMLEHLEERLAPTITMTGVPDWAEQGPGPIFANPNVVNSNGNRVGGSVEAIAPHPTDQNIVYVGTTNGGVWKTTNAAGAAKAITWTPLTDELESLSISALALSPLDPNRVYAGTGPLSIQAPNPADRGGGPAVGLYRSDNGGQTWVNLGNEDGDAGFRGETVVSVVPTRVTFVGGQAVFVGTMDGGGLYFSLDSGRTWALLSGALSVLPAGDVSSVALDPNNPNRVVVGIAGQRRFGGGRNVAVGQAGIYDGTIQPSGAVLWAKRDVNIPQAQLDAAGRVEVALGPTAGSPMVVALLGPQPNDDLVAVYRSTNGGASWRRILNQVQTNPAQDGSLAFAILPDRGNANAFFIAGDRVSGFPFNGNAYRVVVDDTTNANDAWNPITENLPSVTITDAAPHNNARALTFDAGGFLVIGNDGGLARFGAVGPNGQRPWISLVGDMAAVEAQSVGFDDANDRIFGGSLRTGSWDETGNANDYVSHTGVGELLNAADTTSRPTTRAYRYGSSRGLNSFVRRAFDRSDDAVYPRGFITFLGQNTNQPIQINTPVPHGLASGDRVRIENVVFNGQANDRNWFISVIDANTFSLNGSSFNGTFGNSGTWRKVEGISQVAGGAGGRIEVTSFGPHGLLDGESVTILNVAGNTQANGGTFVVSVVSPTVFLLNGTSFNGTLGGGGVFYLNHQVLLRNSVGGANFSGITETVGAASVPFALNSVDPRRMLLGFSKVYEDADTSAANGLAGDVITDISSNFTGLTGTVTALAYGGRRGGLDRPEVAFVATSSGRVYYRNESDSTFFEGFFQGVVGSIRDMVLDPDDWRRVYVIADADPDPAVTNYRVFMTPNIVTTFFTDVTNNLAGFTPDIRTLAIWDDTPNIDGDAVPLVGGYGGVYRMLTGAPGTCFAGNPNVWSLYGQGLPYATVYDLNVSGDQLLAATFGRGVWEVADVSSTLRTNAVLTVTGTAAADQMVIEQVAANHRRMRVSDGINTDEFDTRIFETVIYNTLAGNDTITARTAGEDGDDLQWMNFLLDVDGGDGTDQLLIDDSTDFAGRVTSVTGNTIDFGFSETLFNLCGFVSYDNVEAVTLDLGLGNDLLATGNGADNVWNLTGLNSGTLIGGGLNVTFTGAENLTGGTGFDNFIFNPAGGVDGNIAGGKGFDTLDYSPFNSPVTTNLQTRASTAIGGVFSEIEALIGSSASDTLIGANIMNTWRILAADPRNVNGNFQFSAIENLTGGTLTDLFLFFAGATLLGNLDGGAGIDTLDYSLFDAPVTVNLAALKATAVKGSTSNFEDLIGSSKSDTLIGEDNSNVWTLMDVNKGSVDKFTFDKVENLTGGTKDDVFRFQGGRIDGNLDGGAGNDTMDLSNLPSMRVMMTSVGLLDGISFTLSASPPPVGGSIRNMNEVVGSKDGVEDKLVSQMNREAQWSLTSPNGGIYKDTSSRKQLTFSNFEFYTGGPNIDSFSIEFDGKINALIDGGANNDRVVVTFSTAERTWLINSNDILLDNQTMLVSVENVFGGAGIDRFIVPVLPTIVRTLDGGESGPDLVDLSAHRRLKVVVVTAPNLPLLPRKTRIIPSFAQSPDIRMPVNSSLLLAGDGTLESPGPSDFQLKFDAALASTSAKLSLGDTSLNFKGVNKIISGSSADKLTVSNGVETIESDIVKPDGTKITRKVVRSGLEQSLSYDGGGGNDQITIVGTEFNDTFDLRLNTINLNGKVLTFLNAEGMTIYGGNGNDTFLIDKPSYAVPVISVVGQGGADTFVVAPSLTSTILAFGGAGDTLRIPSITGISYPRLPAGTRSYTLTFGGKRRPIAFFDFDRILIAGARAQFLP